MNKLFCTFLILFIAQLNMAFASDINSSIIKCADETFDASDYIYNWNDELKDEWLKIHRTFDEKKHYVYYLDAMEKCEARRLKAPTVFDFRYRDK